MYICYSILIAIYSVVKSVHQPQSIIYFSESSDSYIYNPTSMHSKFLHKLRLFISMTMRQMEAHVHIHTYMMRLY